MAKRGSGGFADCFSALGILDEKKAKEIKNESAKREQDKINSNMKSVSSKAENKIKGKGNQGNKGGKSKKISGQYSGTYVSAPYNFVSFYNDVVEVEEAQLQNRKNIEESLLSGEITYSFQGKTPVLVSDGKDHFFKNEYGKYAIPGSTMRGLIRSNTQILGLSGFDQDIDDYSLMYRNVAAGANQKYYNDNLLGAGQIVVDGKQLSILKNVAAGYLMKEGDSYYIYKCVVEEIRPELCAMNYYVLNERTIKSKLNDNGFKFFKNNPQYLQHNFKDSRTFTREVRGNKVHYTGKSNGSYMPFYTPISYELANLKNVTNVGDVGVYQKEGYLVGTGAMQEKKALYVVPAMNADVNKRIHIPEEDVKAYRIDFEKKKNTLKSKFKNAPEQLEKIYGLPKEGEIKPIFYIQLGEKLYFGPTPRLRVFYDHNIKEGLRQKKVDFDLANSILGMSNQNASYKSKVSFSDAIAYGAKEGEAKKKVLAEPKPTSYLDYIKQTVGEDISTYNTDQFELRGVKQYWLHEGVSKFGENIANENVGSLICPLDKNTEFKGKVRFKNLTKEELGLLVWSIKLNSNSGMNVGKAKAYGYGVIKLQEIGVKVLNTKKAYLGSLDELCGEIYDDSDPEELIECYKRFINKKINGNIDQLEHIKEFFIMKNIDEIPNDDLIRYMHLGDRIAQLEDEFKNRTNKCLPLPQVEYYGKGK